MSLQRAKQMLEEYYSKLGITYPSVDWLLELIEQMQGGVPRFKPYMFSVSFINVKHCPHEIIDSVDRRDIPAILEENSWTEDPEDLAQEIIINIAINGFTGKTANTLLLRDFLVHKNGLFRRYIRNTDRWINEYTIRLEDNRTPEPSCVLFCPHKFLFKTSDDKMCLFNKYLLYLRCILGMSNDDTSSILQLNNNTTIKYFKNFFKDLQGVKL